MWLCFDPSIQACLFPSSSSQGAELFIHLDLHLSLLLHFPSIHRNSACSPGFLLDLAPSTCLFECFAGVTLLSIKRRDFSSQASLKLVRYTLAVVFSNILHPLARLIGPRIIRTQELLWNCPVFFFW
jgi:hypothetical protein